VCAHEGKFIADKLLAYLGAFNICHRRGRVLVPWGHGHYYYEKPSAMGREVQLFN